MPETEGVRQESIFIAPRASGGTDYLHVHRFYTDPQGPPALLVHGAVENSRVFYSRSGKKGFAPYLASQGFDVYVVDLRGRGRSKPRISRQSKFGQNEAITQDLPAFVELIKSRRGDVPQYWIAHSWGGVLLLSFFARFAEFRPLVRGMVFFGSKRSVQVQNPDKWLKVDFFWKFFCRVLVWVYGYLPANRWGIGSDNESARSHWECVRWVKPGPWIDPTDAFDYGKALRENPAPPILFMGGSRDQSLGHPFDIRRLAEESCAQDYDFELLLGYGHVDMLTKPRAVQDHFPRVLEWLREKGK